MCPMGGGGSSLRLGRRALPRGVCRGRDCSVAVAVQSQSLGARAAVWPRICVCMACVTVSSSMMLDAT